MMPARILNISEEDKVVRSAKSPLNEVEVHVAIVNIM